MAEQWNLTITSPDGTNGQFTADPDLGHDQIVDEVTKFVQAFQEASSGEPVAGIQGVAPRQQQAKQARKQ